MQAISLHPIIFYFLLFFEVLLMFMLAYLGILYYKKYFNDILIFLDKTNRWNIIYDKIRHKNNYNYENKKYFLVEKSGLLNRKGKALYIFSVNKPQPLQISYDNNKWLSSESMMSIINNDLVQKLVKTTEKFKDNLVLFGAIGGIIAGMASVVILLKQFGAI